MIAPRQTFGPLTAQCLRTMSSFGHSVVEPETALTETEAFWAAGKLAKSRESPRKSGAHLH
jgi:hypothetical protein